MIKRPWMWAAFGLTLLAIPVVATLVARAQRGDLPHLGQVPAFALTDQGGRALTGDDMAGKVWVADFIFTSCSEICPKLTGEMANLQRYVLNSGTAERVRLVSITVDPERDTVTRLAAYAAGFRADPTLWKFATGPADAVKDAVVRGFKIGVTREKDESASDGFAILHGTRFVLVDARGAIRGYYDAGEAAAMARLRTDLDRLVERGGT